MANHKSLMSTMNISVNEENGDLLILYLIHKLHKNPYRKRYIVGSSTCSIKELSMTITKMLPVV